MEKTSRQLGLWGALAIVALCTFAGNAMAEDIKADKDLHFKPGNLVLSRSVYDNKKGNVLIGEPLPPNCPASTGSCVTAAYNGLYPTVFNNAPIDGSFGITSVVYLDQITPWGGLINTLEVPNSLEQGINLDSDQLVTSFSSKSEAALNLSLDGRYLTFMGYVAPVNAIDVSNSNTPMAIDPTNPVGEEFLRAVAMVDGKGKFHFTTTNAYSGNNGRAAILNDIDGADFFYTSGNAGNGSTPQPNGVILGAGAQIIDPLTELERLQDPQLPTPVASFSATEIAGNVADKLGKDDNFRGLTIFQNVIYYTKGSGGNGVNTVYFVDTTGTACPNGYGLPSPFATLPTTPLADNLATLQTTGLPNNMCVLAGFPTKGNKDKGFTAVNFPFGVWFADPNTLYVADEGDGTYADAATDTLAGLEKWVFNPATMTWQFAYTLQNGLNLGVQYTVPGYPTGINAATGVAWAPETDGLRNITGRVDEWGNVTIYGITSTVSGGGDQGADPNRLVIIKDTLSYKTAAQAANEKFEVLRTAKSGEVLRGISYTPGTDLQ